MPRFGRLSICGHPFFELLSLAIANTLTLKEVANPGFGRALAIMEIVLMLSIIRNHERLTVRLSGRLEGSSAEDLRLAACPPSALDIDLSGVTSMDCTVSAHLSGCEITGRHCTVRDLLSGGYAKVPTHRQAFSGGRGTTEKAFEQEGQRTGTDLLCGTSSREDSKTGLPVVRPSWLRSWPRSP